MSTYESDPLGGFSLMNPGTIKRTITVGICKQICKMHLQSVSKCQCDVRGTSGTFLDALVKAAGKRGFS